MRRLLFLIPATALWLASVSCMDGDIYKGCKHWCRCHKGTQSESSCRETCGNTLRALKKHDRARERQVADCLAAQGERKCTELTLCAQGVLTPPPKR